jgi:BolA family transcriptional regulator, general stress-responsive regulator
MGATILTAESGSGTHAGAAAPILIEPSGALQKVQRMNVKETMIAKLTAAFAPESLEVEDESHKHAGHSGARPGGQTHFRVSMTSAAFVGTSRIERHRLVNAVLADELNDRVHALALTLNVPAVPVEDGSNQK